MQDVAGAEGAMRRHVIKLGSTGIGLECYLTEDAPSCARPAVIVLPGGAYVLRAAAESGIVAKRFRSLGYEAFVLRYSTYPGGTPYPGQAAELMEAICYLKDHSAELGVDRDRIYALGFSAGAHVAVTLAERAGDKEIRGMAGIAVDADASELLPAGLVLCYPLLAVHPLKAPSELLSISNKALFGTETLTESECDSVDLVRGVRAGMPRTFIWQSAQDAMCDQRDTLRFASRLLDCGTPCELHLFEEGAHGMSMADEESVEEGASAADAHVATWVMLADQWMHGVKDVPAAADSAE